MIPMKNVNYILGSEEIDKSPMPVYADEVCAFIAEVSAKLMQSPLVRQSPELSALAFWGRRGGGSTFFLKAVFKIRQICYTKSVQGAIPRHSPVTRKREGTYESVYHRRRPRHRGRGGPGLGPVQRAGHQHRGHLPEHPAGDVRHDHAGGHRGLHRQPRRAARPHRRPCRGDGDADHPDPPGSF